MVTPDLCMTQAVLDQGLWTSAMEGDFETCAKLLAQGANPECSDSLALRRASRGGHVECVKLLLPFSNAKACDSQALRDAAVGDHLECVRLLIPASEPRARQSLALRLVSERGFVGCLKLLIPVSDVVADESSALCIAAENGHVECVNLLLEASSDSDRKNSHALILAAQNDHIEIAKVLAPLASPKHQALAFESACEFGAVECAQLLIHCVDSPQMLDRSLRSAINGGHANVFLLLTNHAHTPGYNPLLTSIRKTALRKGHDRLATVLLALIEKNSIGDSSYVDLYPSKKIIPRL